MLVEFYGLRFQVPQGWTDITEDLPEGSPPSLARPTGVGVLQFSIAKYRDGNDPNITTDVLRSFVEDFFKKNHVACENITEYRNGLISVEGISSSGGEMLLARYFSNGNDVVLATYVSSEVESNEIESDMAGVETVLNSMEF